jgi:hypothetical protein
MRRFWGNHPGTQQARGGRHVKPSTLQERLAAMERGLANMREIFGDRHWLVLKQIGRIAEMKREVEQCQK